MTNSTRNGKARRREPEQERPVEEAKAESIEADEREVRWKRKGDRERKLKR